VRNMRLKGQILEYIGDKKKVRLRDLLFYLNEEKGRHYGKRKVAGNLTALGWRQESRESDVYKRVIEDDRRRPLYD